MPGCGASSRDWTTSFGPRSNSQRHPVDNITHTLIGVVLAELTLPRETTSITSTTSPASSTRRLFVAAGAIAANAPDLDLVYVGITPFPLGYLLHHRGHTHTVIGVIVQVVLIALACQLVLRLIQGPGVWRTVSRARLWGLIAVALASHIALDACNSYGVHPFYPFDARWYFGDALFIFEPWLWLVLCLTVALNVRRPTIRALLMTPMAVLLVALAFVSVISVPTLAALMVSGLALAWWTRSWTPRARAAGAAAALVLFVAAMSAASAKARADTRELMAADTHTNTHTQTHTRGEIVDIALTPDPAAPLCWTVIAIERDQETDTFVTRRGTLSLRPAWQSPERCASHRLMRLQSTRRVGDGRLLWSEEIRQPLAALRNLAARDCWGAAWLQFGRAPVLRADRIFDLRFEGPRGNFTTMTLRQPSVITASTSATPAAAAPATMAPCPANMTNWAMPRADLALD
jgi:inner membrane protein